MYNGKCNCNLLAAVFAQSWQTDSQISLTNTVLARLTYVSIAAQNLCPGGGGGGKQSQTAASDYSALAEIQMCVTPWRTTDHSRLL